MSINNFSDRHNGPRNKDIEKMLTVIVSAAPYFKDLGSILPSANKYANRQITKHDPIIIRIFFMYSHPSLIIPMVRV